MELIRAAREMQEISLSYLKKGKNIGFVPTMGALHQGHLSLVEKCCQENDINVVSIFVNPTQFGPNEDFDNYPRVLDDDLEKISQYKVSYVLYPEVKEIFPKTFSTYVETYGISEKLCGEKRPNHFRGVTTVVSKLFNIVLPTNAYFGQKDYQQCLIISKMIEDLNFYVKLHRCPIFRENDGLAMSSRNKYLNKEERLEASCLYQSLKIAEDKINNGEKNLAKIKKIIEELISSKIHSKIDYISIVDPHTLENLTEFQNKILIALAVYFGKARLIDNLLLE